VSATAERYSAANSSRGVAMYRVSYTVDARANGFGKQARTRRTEYFASEPEALARVRQLLDEEICIAVCARKNSSRTSGVRSDLLKAASNGAAPAQPTETTPAVKPLPTLANG
jgi:hypothetical protein